MISFPGLGLEFPISNVAFRIFGMNVYWYGLIIAFGFALVVFLATHDSKKFGIDPESIVDLVLWATIPSIIFARLYYVIFSWDQYKGDIYKIINIREGGIAIYGAIIGAVLVAILFARSRKIGVMKLIDFGIPYVALAQAIGRWGNFFNQEAYGTHTDLPWGMGGDRIYNGPVHPTFLYESLWNLGIFLFLVWYRKRKRLDGEVFYLYMILYGAGRFWIEGLRIDSLMLGSMRISQVLAFVFAVVFTIALIIGRRRAYDRNQEVELGSSNYGNILKTMESDSVANGESPAGDEGSHAAELPEKDTADELGESGQEQEVDIKNP